MRVDNQRLRPFRELRAFLGGSVNDNWNGQLNPLAAALLHPLFCVCELLVAHRTLDCTPHFTLCEGCERERTMNEKFLALPMAARDAEREQGCTGRTEKMTGIVKKIDAQGFG